MNATVLYPFIGATLALNVLLIEDSTSLRRSLKIGLSNLGFTVDDTGDGAEGLTMALTGDYNLLILDIMLPSLDGLYILTAIRAANKDSRILILSARNLVEDKVNALMLGADDYLTKPFAFDELHARLLCLMRREKISMKAHKLTIAPFELDIHLNKFYCQKTDVLLTPNEYKIIECLFTNQGQIITPEKLSTYMAGHYDAMSKNTIEAHLSAARKKIRLMGYELPIKTKRGFGYFIENDLCTQ